MKKTLTFLCMLTTTIILTACGTQAEAQTSGSSAQTFVPPTEHSSQTAVTQEPGPTQSEKQPSARESGNELENTEPGDTGANILVAYFSATGNTKVLAEYAADAMGADIYEIIPEEPYTDADLDYGNTQSRSSMEMDDPNARPAISGKIENMEQYDIIFLGYPIWWGEAPRILSTFMESYDFDGKTIVPFCTSGGSGIGSSARNLHELAGPDATWLDGERLSNTSSRDDMVSWISGLGLEVTVR